jgi:hypothetical protein
MLSKALIKKGHNDWVISKLCHYDDFSSYLKYKNEFEILENAEAYILPEFNPILTNLTNYSAGQQLLTKY